jgi:hypothetical protein
MRSRSSLYAIRIFVLMVGVAAVSAAGAAPATDACSLLTQVQLSAALAVSMDAGKYVTPGFVRTCTWAPSSGPTAAIKYFTLYLQSADGFEAGKSLIQLGKGKGAAVVTSVSGVGDDAYYASFGSNITSLIVKKRDLAFKLTLYGASAPEKVMVMEKTLALQVLSKL